MAPGASPLTPLSPERLMVAELACEDEFWSAMLDSKPWIWGRWLRVQV